MEENLTAKHTAVKNALVLTIYKNQKLLLILLFLTVMMLSVLVIPGATLSEERVGALREALSEQQRFVSRLSLVTASFSIALSAFPGDFATPIANELANLTSYFILILAMITIQRALFSVLGYLTFYLLIPAACIFGIFYAVSAKKALLVISFKMAVLGLALFAVIPVSVFTGEIIHRVHAESMQDVYDVDLASGSASAVDEAAENMFHEAQQRGNVFQRTWNSLSRAAGNFTERVKNDIVHTFNRIMRDLGIQIAASIIVPIFTVILMIWLVKVLFGLDKYIMHTGSKVHNYISEGILKAGRGTRFIIRKNQPKRERVDNYD